MCACVLDYDVRTALELLHAVRALARAKSTRIVYFLKMLVSYCIYCSKHQ